MAVHVSGIATCAVVATRQIATHVALVARVRLARIKNRLASLSREALHTHAPLPLPAHARAPVETRHVQAGAMQFAGAPEEPRRTAAAELSRGLRRADGAVLAGVKNWVAQVAVLTGASVEADATVAEP